MASSIFELASPATPPEWRHCGHGATPEDPVGCRGIHVPGHTTCLAHLDEAHLDAYLASLTPGARIDHRGTTFTPELLNRLLQVLRDTESGCSRIGDAGFGSAIFQGDAGFRSVTFQGSAEFGSAIFQGDAGFRSVTFQGSAEFGSVTFQGNAEFGSVTFQGYAWFGSATFQSNTEFQEATFQSDAWFTSAIFQSNAGFGSVTFQGNAGFDSVTFQSDAEFGSTTFQSNTWFTTATFQGYAWFGSATFQSNTEFQEATFQSDAWFISTTFQSNTEFQEATFQSNAGFQEAVFERSDSLGPLVCAERVVLSGAVFGGPVTLSLAARHVECRRTRWASTAEVRLRFAAVDFSSAVFEYPLTIAAEAGPFILPNGRQVAEDALSDVPDAGVRLVSLRGVDAAHLVLADVDLSPCLLTRTVHLDQVRLEGTCSFDTVPPGAHWARWRRVRFTERRTLAEEHHWRAQQPAAVQGWKVVPGAGPVGPAQLAPVYRALRKALEDGANAPGAADFYYGEMEMRRHDRAGTPRAERVLLRLYWALSGYGLRAGRALGWLAAAMLITVVLLMGLGLPEHSPKQEATGTVPAGGGRVTFVIDKTDPVNPTGDRFTGERFEKALHITLNSVVFRSSGQDLTTAGTYIEMTSRFIEPVLLTLAVLAVRGRVKR